jgi:pimeloyl-ACP methyl ester carboxylesterase
MNQFGQLAGDSYGTADSRPPLVLLHGLSYDHRQWGPVIDELADMDPGRRVLTLDLPGHGASQRRESYGLDEVAAAVHEAVTVAGLRAPVVVGHSLGGAVATSYGATYPVRGVVNVDQPLLVGGFSDMLRGVEPVLRGPDHLDVWQSLLDRMRIDLLPPSARELVRTASTPRQDLLLGYWGELLVTSAEEIGVRTTAQLSQIRELGVGYHYVTGDQVDPAYRNWLESVVPDVDITVLPGSGHFPHLAHPAEFAAVLVGC